MGSILVVENDPLSRELALRVLLAGGHRVETARTAEEALARAPKLKPSLVLMDLNMPGMDGVEATRRLRDDPSTAGIAVAILSAQAFADDVQRARDAGCVDYLAKPIGATELLARVDAILSSAGKSGKLMKRSGR